jgi:hypothetical protein
MQGIELAEGDVWGHRKDLDDYFSIDEATLKEIREMSSRGLSNDQVTAEIQKRARLAPDLVKYIAKATA